MTNSPNTLALTIHGMHCGSCALLIDDALADLPGVLTSTTSAKTHASTITHDHRANPQQIITTIESLGYRATPSPH
jgi:copper chaperone